MWGAVWWRSGTRSSRSNPLIDSGICVGQQWLYTKGILAEFHRPAMQQPPGRMGSVPRLQTCGVERSGPARKRLTPEVSETADAVRKSALDISDFLGPSPS